MIKTSVALLSAGVFLLSAASVSAHETGTPHEHATASSTVDLRIRPNRAIDLRAEIRARAQNAKETRADLRNTIQDIRLDSKDRRTDLRVDTKAQMQNASSSDERRAIQKGAQIERRDIRDDRKASTTPIRMEFKTLARQHVGLIVGRFEVALRQFDGLVTRIQSRIDKLQARGAATASLEAQLTVAISAVAQARADVQALVSIMESVDASSDVKTVRQEIDAAIKKANASMKAAHNAFAKLARELVSLSGSVRADAEITTTTNQ